MKHATRNDLSEAIENDRASIWHHSTQHKAFESVDPWVVVEGKGMRLWDAQGKQYLDAAAGGVYAVNVGYGRDTIADAIRDQLTKLHFYAPSAGNVPAANFARKLLEKMPGMSRVYYSNSGSEANEKVFKMARQISARRSSGKKYKILYRERDYHGSSIATLAAGGQAERSAQYGPYPEGFVPVPHCLEYRKQWDVQDYGRRAADAIEEVILREGPETIGLLCLEPITAGGGIIVPPEGYWQRVQEICKTYDVMLHIDEVVCGLGRTGKWFGYQHFDIIPDFVTLAKGTASGYAAIACTITTERVFEMFKDDAADPMGYFRDISTFGGCAGGAAAAIENLRILEDEGLVDNASEMGAYLHQKLTDLAERHAVIGNVRGRGLLQGVELVLDRETKEPVDEAQARQVGLECKARGVLIGVMNRSIPGLNTTLCLAPPLIATRSDIDEICRAIDGALTAVFSI